MPIFYAPQIATTFELPEEESMHCVRVLRLSEGKQIEIVDGKGVLYQATITTAHPKRCRVSIEKTEELPICWNGEVHIGIAPTKNMDRMEWFVEKATEIGINSITLLRCRHSERKEIKQERLQKVAIAAMKQSQQAVMPIITELLDFKTWINSSFEGDKYIAHCDEREERKLLKHLYTPNSAVRILIGPEGDFSPEEIELALANGYQQISLGGNRLRTETAALAACHTIQVINQ